MGLDDLEAEIRDDFAAKARSIALEHDARCQEILAEAEGKAEAVLAAGRAAAREESEALRRRRLASSRLAARRVESSAREAVVGSVLGQVREALVEYSKSPEYLLALPGIAAKASAGFRPGFVIHVRDQDKKALKVANVKCDLHAIGGVVVDAQDGSSRVLASLDAAYDAMLPGLREAVCRRLGQ